MDIPDAVVGRFGRIGGMDASMDGGMGWAGWVGLKEWVGWLDGMEGWIDGKAMLFVGNSAHE